MFLRASKTTMLVCLLLCVGTSGNGCPTQDQGSMVPGMTGPDDNPMQDDNLPPGDNLPPDSDPPPGQLPAQWNTAFDTTGLGALSSVWGSGPNDVYVVGGSGGPSPPPLAEMYHYDGVVWRTIDVSTPDMDRFALVWVFGFGPNDVYAVGLGGTVLHYDGVNWNKLDAGTSKSLWGIWGSSPTDIWIVGEGPRSFQGDPSPTIIHYDGVSEFTLHVLPLAQNDRLARKLFKVWGIGSKVFAVGAAGLIVEYDAASNLWSQVFGGVNANEDFVSLWGTSESNIVAVGGRTGARVSDFDGSNWTTHKPSAVGGLNAVFMDEPAMAIAGGVGGYVCNYNPATDIPVAETAPTTTDIHAIWGDGAGKYYAVGGDFLFPFNGGVCVVRTYGDPGITPVPPVGP